MIAGFPLPESLARCLTPSAPEELRLAAARGAIPMPPAERLVGLTMLLGDPSAAVRSAAKEAWEHLPPLFLEDAVGDARLPEPVLDFVAALSGADHAVALRLARHPQVGPRALERLLEAEEDDVLSAVAQNQRALAHCPEIVAKLLRSPRLHPGDRSRLADLHPEVAPDPELPADEEIEDVPLPPDLPRELLEDTEAPAEKDAKNLYQLVQGMSVAEKIKLANLGSKEARRLLVRDTNRVVQRAVIRSPKIREDEVMPIAQDRTVSDEILRLILERRDWLKHYPIRLALCQNPKTPPPRALRLLENLQERDLRQIAKSRNVPSPVAAGARRLLTRRGKA